MQNRKMIISTAVKFIFIVALTASNEVLAQIRGNNGVKIKDMVVRIMAYTKPLMFGPILVTELI